jgi:hypothetical protein
MNITSIEDARILASEMTEKLKEFDIPEYENVPTLYVGITARIQKYYKG